MQAIEFVNVFKTNGEEAGKNIFNKRRKSLQKKLEKPKLDEQYKKL